MNVLELSLLIASIIFGTVFLVLGVHAFVARVPQDEREHMDPLPPLLKLVWPLVRPASWYIGARLPVDGLQRLQGRLQRAGLDYLLTAEQFAGLQVVSFLLIGGATSAALCAADVLQAPWVLLALVVGYAYPWAWLRDARERRKRHVLKMLPIYVDFIRMAVEAGLNLSGAIAQAVDKGPEGPLRQELGRVLRELRAGFTRADALRRMAARLDLDAVHSLVGTLVQAERVGGSLSGTLKAISEQRRAERFQRAEKQALEAPVKLVGPLALFIFPVTFIILGFPIVMRFINEGIL